MIPALLALSMLAGSCHGEEWWPIKTGIDPDVQAVDLGTIQPTTIAELVSITPPQHLKADRRRIQEERSIYRLSDVHLVLVKKEADCDLHIVVETSGQTMIVESADPTMATSSYWRTLIREVREEIASEDLKHEDLVVTVVGPAFLDKLHGQTGHAPNGVEIHPILGWCLGTGCNPVGLR